MAMTNWDVSNTSTVILGAGFSAAATDGRMPLMGNFFDRLDKSKSPLLHEYVSTLGCDVKTANVETVLLNLDQIRTTPKSALRGWGDKWKDNVPQLQRALEDYVLERIKDGLEIDDRNWAVDLLAECCPGSTTISMNYDNIAESVLSRVAHRQGLPCPHCRMVRLLGTSCNCLWHGEIAEGDDGWRGTLIKPHGSIAWKRCTNKDCCNCECLVADAQCMPFEPCCCENCWQSCSPAIVMPTMGKHLDDLPEIGVMWQAARSAIADAESLLIFGFSMPVSDELLTQMIRITIHESKKLRRVGVIDLDPDGVLNRFKRCLPSDHSVETLAFKVDRRARPMWLVPISTATS